MRPSHVTSRHVSISERLIEELQLFAGHASLASPVRRPKTGVPENGGGSGPGRTVTRKGSSGVGLWVRSPVGGQDIQLEKDTS